MFQRDKLRVSNVLTFFEIPNCALSTSKKKQFRASNNKQKKHVHAHTKAHFQLRCG